MNFTADLMFAAMYTHSANLKCRAIAEYFRNSPTQMPDMDMTGVVLLRNESEENDESNNVWGTFYVTLSSKNGLIAVYRENERGKLDNMSMSDWHHKIETCHVMSISAFSELASSEELREGLLPGGSQDAFGYISDLHKGFFW